MRERTASFRTAERKTVEESENNNQLNENIARLEYE